MLEPEGFASSVRKSNTMANPATVWSAIDPHTAWRNPTRLVGAFNLMTRRNTNRHRKMEEPAFRLLQ
jgi:hypothetical protein